MQKLYNSITSEYDNSSLSGKIDIYEELLQALEYIKEDLVKNNSLETLYGYGIDLDDLKNYISEEDRPYIKVL